MERRIINPWTWQDKYGFVQGNEVRGAERVLYTAGVVSVDGDGNLLNAGDMTAQIGQILDNMEIILRNADLELADGCASPTSRRMLLRSPNLAPLWFSV